MAGLSNRDRKKILQSLKSGVVPRRGIHHIQVGRSREIKALMSDMDDVSHGSTAFRIVIGDYGSGKSFFLLLTKETALQQGLCVASADLSPERRLYSSTGQARALYSELARELSTKTKPDGDGLKNIIEKYLQKTDQASISKLENQLSQYSLGFYFIKVLQIYRAGIEEDDTNKCFSALKWLRGEYTTKTEANKDLGVKVIISDNNYYDALKALSTLVVNAGYKGLMICIDEMVNLLRISQTNTRKNNYEQLLKILNDLLQGTASNISFLLSGTPDFLTDDRKGLYAYEALRSRLQENEFAEQGFFDSRHPVIRLKPLSNEEIYNLIRRVGEIYDQGDVSCKGDNEAIKLFLGHCNSKLGSEIFTSPRTVIRSYLNLRDILNENPDADINNLIESTPIEADIDPELGIESIPETDSDLIEFKL
ncbi:MAG: ATP-binding protein [Prochlorococcus sp.]